MFRKCFLLGFLVVVLYTTSYSQALTVDTYSNQLLFNIFKEKPDTAIRSFLRLYTPSLLEKKQGPALGGSKDASQYTAEIHSFIFTKHPFFTGSFTTGKLDFFCQRFNEPKGMQVYNVKLWFEFDTQQEAEMAFSKLVETFIPISTNKRFSSSNGARKAEFSDTKGQNGFNKVQIRLTADNLDHHDFKILFETENDF